MSSLLERIGRGHLVGRAAEQARAAAELSRVLAGEARVLIISGEPGVGKTRLAREVMVQMQAAQGLALAAACYSEGEAPYAAVSRLIRDSLPQVATLGLPDHVIADLLALAPGLRSYFPTIAPNPPLDPLREQQRLFESVNVWAEALSAQAPLVILVDDVHWADSATLSLLRQLASRGRNWRLLLVLTLREAEAGEAAGLAKVLHDLDRERLTKQLGLTGLDRDETRDLLAEIFAEEITSEFLDGIYSQTDGNPFFIEEVCKTLIEEGKLTYRDGHWHRPSMAEIAIPQTVRAAIELRLARLPQAGQQVLRQAAILGREFEFETLRRAVGLSEEELIEALEGTLQAQLVTEVGGGEGAVHKFSFVHALIPTTLRESILAVRRRALHLHAAQALEAVHPEDFETLAYHYTEAGDADRAREFALQAGDRARTWAPKDASRLYRVALAHWPDADKRGRAEALSKLGYCLWVIAQVDESLACYQDAYQLFDELEDRLQCGETQRRMGRIYWEQADREAALLHYHRAFELLEQGPETVELAWAISSISQVHMLGFDPDEAIAWGERGLAMARRLGADAVIVDALNNLGSTYSQAGNWDKGLALLDECVQRALALESPVDICRAYFNTGVALQKQCRYAEAMDWCEKLHDYAAKSFSRSYVTISLWRMMWIHWDMGRWRAALSYRSQLSELAGGIYTTWTKRLFAAIDLDLGKLHEAQQTLEETLQSALRADDLQTTVPHLGLLVQVYTITGQNAEAARMVGLILDSVNRRPYPFVDCLKAVLFACRWAAGQSSADAAEMSASCLAHLERLHHALQTEESRASLAEGRGCLLVPDGRARAAGEQLREAAAAWQSIGRRYDEARALASLVPALQATGDKSGASTAGVRAMAIVEALSGQLDEDLRSSFLASPLVLQIRRTVSVRSRSVRPSAAARDLAGLSERELEVLRLVAQGLTNAEIAAQLVLSPLTVNAHVRSIFNKLGVARRTAAVSLAIERGIL